MKLTDWINHVGASKVAEIAGVTPSAVYQWLSFTSVPKVEIAYRLIKCSMGLLTWEGIYGPYAEYHYGAENTELDLDLD